MCYTSPRKTRNNFNTYKMIRNTQVQDDANETYAGESCTPNPQQHPTNMVDPKWTAGASGLLQILQLEYEQAIASYNYRDESIPQEFNIALALMVGIVGVIGFSGSDIGFAPFAFLFGIGFATLYALHSDLMSNTSVKRAVRTRITQLEHNLQQASGSAAPRLFSVCIADRPVTLLERLLKPLASSTQIVWIIRLLILGWIYYGVGELVVRYAAAYGHIL